MKPTQINRTLWLELGGKLRNKLENKLRNKLLLRLQDVLEESWHD